MLLAFTLAFVNIGLFWNNHHHLMMTAKRVDGHVLWANLSLLFFLSLMPFVIRWLDESGFGALPAAAYGVVMLGASLAFAALERTILRIHDGDGALARALDGSRWKERGSTLGFAAAIGLAFVAPWIAILIYVAIAAIWFIPDRRIERQVIAEHRAERAEHKAR